MVKAKHKTPSARQCKAEGVQHEEHAEPLEGQGALQAHEALAEVDGADEVAEQVQVQVLRRAIMTTLTMTTVTMMTLTTIMARKAAEAG
jgi:hypothetical protein